MYGPFVICLEKSLFTKSGISQLINIKRGKEINTFSVKKCTDVFIGFLGLSHAVKNTCKLTPKEGAAELPPLFA